MIRFIADHTPTKLRLFTGFPDYQPNMLGAMAEGGRSLDPEASRSRSRWRYERVNPPKSGLPKVISRMEEYYKERTPEEIEHRRAHDYRAQGQDSSARSTRSARPRYSGALRHLGPAPHHRRRSCSSGSRPSVMAQPCATGPEAVW
ncbi:MAG: hypothetical protein R2710_06730 [Acidimicrobiales bacterium]